MQRFFSQKITKVLSIHLLVHRGNEIPRSKIGVPRRGKEVENYALDECRILGSGLAALGLSLANTDLCSSLTSKRLGLTARAVML
ncbi:MAG TPA: hypothetical protein DCG20_05950 [Prevotella sp.]|nr:hypothetical protein [Prevotella sp.]